MLWKSKAWEESICVYVIIAHNLPGFSLRLDGFWGQVRNVRVFNLLLIPPKSHLINGLARQADFLWKLTKLIESQLFIETSPQQLISAEQMNRSTCTPRRCHYAWLPTGAVNGVSWGLWLFVVRQMAGNLMELRYRRGAGGPLGVIIRFKQGCVSSQTHPVLWSSPMTQNQSRHTERPGESESFCLIHVQTDTQLWSLENFLSQSKEPKTGNWKKKWYVECETT